MMGQPTELRQLREGVSDDNPKPEGWGLRLNRWFTGVASQPGPATTPFSAIAIRRLHRELRHCFEAPLTDQEGSSHARALMDRYLASSDDIRIVLLRAIALEAARFGAAGSGLSELMDSARIRFFKRFNALPDGLAFLVQLRADMLLHRKSIAALEPLTDDLGTLLAAWFDVGFLDLRPITWDSPASLLEKLMRYEAVHQISSWNDLRNRLDSDRQCYAFFHPRLPNEPLIFVEIAILEHLAQDIGALLDEAAPLENLSKVKWAVFYSISSTQAGLRGVSFGNFLLKRVIDAVRTKYPRLERFATLSPIPGFSAWVKDRNRNEIIDIVGPRFARQLDDLSGGPLSLTGGDVAAWLSHDAERADAAVAQRELGERLAAHYLARRFQDEQPLDPVARFHLGNGAGIERVNWRADRSEKGMRESFGIMVNYRYVVADLDDNLLRLKSGEPRTGRAVARLL